MYMYLQIGSDCIVDVMIAYMLQLNIMKLQIVYKIIPFHRSQGKYAKTDKHTE